MFPDYKLPDPRAGQPVSAHEIANLSKAVKALQPSVGWGMRISKTSQGVMYALDKSVVQKAVKSKMPFDASMSEHEAGSGSGVVRILAGKLWYGLGGAMAEVEPSGMDGDGWDVSVDTLENGLTIGIVCDPGTTGPEGFPVSFTVGVIPSNPSPEEGGASTGWVDVEGMHYFPLVRFVEIQEGGSYTGPYAFTVTAPSSAEGATGNSTYYAVQSHHGDVLYDFGSGAAFIAEITNGGPGTVHSYIAVDGSEVTGELLVVELAETSTLPQGSRVIAHTISVHSLPAGTTGTPPATETAQE